MRAMAETPKMPASAPRALGGSRTWATVAIVALAPLWFVGLFDRGFWTPDEPREADIAWRMSQQSERAIPELAGTPFLEKPPLSYWLSAAASSAFGTSAAAARLPNLLYAAVFTAAIATLAFAMAGADAALIAALIAGSTLLLYRVAIWLAPDASLLAGAALALLGAYLGYSARPGRKKLLCYALMHLGAAWGFMAKSAPGWLVPGLALLSLLIWERRWSELRRWELYAGLVLQVLVIGPWVCAVASSPGGVDSLRVFFWDNIVGRFAQGVSSPGHDYAQGHLNWWGKYLLELPLYLLPWSVLAAAAAAGAWRATRAGGVALMRTAWRFAVCACVPLIALLSLAATARDVYAAPAVLGIALLIGLWSADLPHQIRRLDQLALAATRALIAMMAAAFAGALALLSAIADRPSKSLLAALAALAVAALTFIGLRYAARLQRDGKFTASIAASYGSYAFALILGALLVLPEVDRWQDLGALARCIKHDMRTGDLAVLNPDETTLAMLDYRSPRPFAVLAAGPGGAAQVVSGWLQAHGPQARVLVMLPGHAPGALTKMSARWWARGPPGDGIAAELQAGAGARVTGRYELPQGRRYALLGEQAD